MRCLSDAEYLIHPLTGQPSNPEQYSDNNADSAHATLSNDARAASMITAFPVMLSAKICAFSKAVDGIMQPLLRRADSSQAFSWHHF